MAPSYSIKAVAERTGLSPHVIRAWERRYHAIEPERSSGKHRLYSEEEIERLVALSRAIRSGYSIATIARLSTEEIRALLAKSLSAAPVPDRGLDDSGAPFRDEALDFIARYDAPALEDVLRRGQLALGNQGLLRLVVAPLAQEVGEKWRSGEMTAAHEHFFTATVKIFVGDVNRQYATPMNAPRLIVTTPVGQLHELGAVMAAATAANLGWRPIYLGPSLPAHEIAGVARRNEAAAVALSIVYPDDDPNLENELASLVSLLPEATRILSGGRAARSYIDALLRLGILHADSLDELGRQLDAIRRSLLADRPHR
jgi:DNA-binding transcriptional MerR regulator/methylmalonyl-CoA mutase cobalamin-binding subunit